MEINYKAKIKKLLALAESPVEAEAQAALLKARAAHAENLHTSAFNSGYADGKRFDPKHSLKAGV